jgi:hypothetical protein
VILGSPALRLLARKKLVGVFRKQVRRFKRPSGILFALLGVVVIGGWVTSIVIGQTFGPSGSDTVSLPLLQLIGMGLVFFTAIGALNHRGLYLPSEEIELLFSAPVSRADLVRYRLFANLGRSLFGSAFFGLIVMWRMPHPLFAFLGAMVAMLTLPVLGQAFSILAGSAENRLFARLSKLPVRLFNILGAVFVVAIMLLAINGGRLRGKLQLFGLESLGELVEDPRVAWIGWPIAPWARMIAASSLGEFALWSCVCALLWVLFFELTARLPVDFRELSLQTSADVARRIARARKTGVGASASGISRRAKKRTAPWAFGHGRFGSIAWRKSTSILRKARGTFITGGLIIALLTVLSTMVIEHSGPEAAMGGTILIAAAGTLYLCAGLRFDFREDLDRMDVVKSWPLAPWRIFLATLLPEVLLVSLLLGGAVGLRVAITGDAHPLIMAVLAALPLGVLAWVSIDNAVFLFSPIRYVPGQEGLLQHAGRSVVLMLLRAFALGLAALAVTAAVLLVQALDDWLELGAQQVVGVTVGLVLFVLLCEDVLLVWLGGRALARFDVARDRG